MLVWGHSKHYVGFIFFLHHLFIFFSFFLFCCFFFSPPSKQKTFICKCFSGQFINYCKMTEKLTLCHRETHTHTQRKIYYLHRFLSQTKMLLSFYWAVHDRTISSIHFKQVIWTKDVLKTRKIEGKRGVKKKRRHKITHKIITSLFNRKNKQKNY